MVFTIYIHTSIYYILIPIWKWRYVPVGMFVLIWVWKSKLLIYLSRFPLSLSSLYTTATVNKYDCENSWCCYNLVVMRWTSKTISFPKQKFQHWKQSRKKFLLKRIKAKSCKRVQREFNFESKPNPNNIFWIDPSLLHKITLYTPWCVSILQFHF